ncbi:type I-E CRISPR-associated protein Cas5/CasD [Leucobacter iarius]|uniref:Type I-E CRISPR-associated protein Cas5/CasD n=1 Tax=Leucobacter iarius TaxID=333963 RepID=A0ABN2LR43_9MICO
MPTLLLTLSGPLQAWGSRSRFSARTTEPAPTKSGVLGLVAAAKGVRRTEELTDLAGLRFGVRSDQPGRVIREFQTARSLDGRDSMPLSDRYMLADAVFLAALESSDREFLERLRDHLRSPVFPLSLGRRALPPAGPIPTEILEGTIETAFETSVWRAGPVERSRHRESPQIMLETRIDAAPGEIGEERIRDVPVSFDPERREHRWREVAVSRVWLSNPDFAGVDDDESGEDDGPALAFPDGAHDVFAAMAEGA